MNYIYDILLNFQSSLYDFYEWNVNDDITHIRKIPVFHVAQNHLNEIRNHKIKFDREFLTKIYKKTEVFTKKEIELLSYTCIISSDEEVLALKLCQNGTVIKKSRLLIDEENEVLEVTERLSIFPLHYEMIEEENIVYNKTRKERATEIWLKEEIKKLKDTNIEKLKYLYYECFNKKEKKIASILSAFDTLLDGEWNPLTERIETFFKLTESQK